MTHCHSAHPEPDHRVRGAGDQVGEQDSAARGRQHRDAGLAPAGREHRRRAARRLQQPPCTRQQCQGRLVERCLHLAEMRARVWGPMQWFLGIICCSMAAVWSHCGQAVGLSSCSEGSQRPLGKSRTVFPPDCDAAAAPYRCKAPLAPLLQGHDVPHRGGVPCCSCGRGPRRCCRSRQTSRCRCCAAVLLIRAAWLCVRAGMQIPNTSAAACCLAATAALRLALPAA